MPWGHFKWCRIGTPPAQERFAVQDGVATSHRAALHALRWECECAAPFASDLSGHTVCGGCIVCDLLWATHAWPHTVIEQCVNAGQCRRQSNATMRARIHVHRLCSSIAMLSRCRCCQSGWPARQCVAWNAGVTRLRNELRLGARTGLGSCSVARITKSDGVSVLSRYSRFVAVRTLRRMGKRAAHAFDRRRKCI
jgi:hypothetical protein